LEVAREESFFLPGREIRKLVVIELARQLHASRANWDCSRSGDGASWPRRGDFTPAPLSRHAKSFRPGQPEVKSSDRLRKAPNPSRTTGERSRAAWRQTFPGRRSR